MYMLMKELQNRAGGHIAEVGGRHRHRHRSTFCRIDIKGDRRFQPHNDDDARQNLNRENC